MTHPQHRLEDIFQRCFNYTGIDTIILEEFECTKHIIFTIGGFCNFSPTVKRFLMNIKCFSKRLNSLSNLEIDLSLLKFWNLVPDLFYSVPRINIFLWIKLMML